MSKAFCQGYPRDANIIDVEEFNAEYNSKKSLINGGLDRDAIPAGSITRSRIADNAFHKTYLTTGIALNSNYQTYSGTSFTALTAEEYSGGWVPLESQDITTKEGFLKLEFKIWTWLQKYADWHDDGDKWCMFKVTYNGSTVCQSWKNYMPFTSHHLTGGIPVSDGGGTVTVWFQVSPVGSAADTTHPLFFCEGGQLLIINRYR